MRLAQHKNCWLHEVLRQPAEEIAYWEAYYEIVAEPDPHYDMAKICSVLTACNGVKTDVKDHYPLLEEESDEVKINKMAAILSGKAKQVKEEAWQ